MNTNYSFCNESFLYLFFLKPYIYNQFMNERYTRKVIQSMDNNCPKFNIIFKYNEKKRIRATFIVFDGDIGVGDVKCICALYDGNRTRPHCYFFELYGDNTVGCIEVFINKRVVIKLNVGDSIDNYFDLICSMFDDKYDNEFSALFYKESDNFLRIIDFNYDDFDDRKKILLSDGKDNIDIKYFNEVKIIENNKYQLFFSDANKNYIVCKNIYPDILNICVSDINLFNNQY